jgi:membrane protein DedA with SNARE-associated domain
MSFPLAVLAATAGNLAGSLLAYALGATRLLGRLPMLGAVLGRWEGLIDRYGTRAVLIARLLPLARTFVSLLAGARRIPLGPFIAMTTIGCGIWAAGFVLAGLIAANAWTSVNSWLGRALLAAALLALGASALRKRHSQ